MEENVDFKDSRTYQNLQKSYNEELMYSGKYELFGDIARTDGYMEISVIFNIVAGQNREHARIWLRKINEGTLPSTSTNLLQASEEENNIAGNEYQDYAKIAREEGYDDIAALFAGVANINYYHASLFQQQYNNIITNQVFCKPEETLWICMKCGNIMSRVCAPEVCPVCGFPQGYYRVLSNCIY